MPTRRHVLLSLSAFAAFGLASEGWSSEPRYFGTGGAALRGYDPVAYFTQGKPVKGSRKHAVMWQGTYWYFSSARNREAFEANPRAYEPQYGGYCAYAVSRGYTASTDPAAWRIESGKLYLNHSLRVREIWSQDIPGNIARADGNWPSVLSN